MTVPSNLIMAKQKEHMPNGIGALHMNDNNTQNLFDRLDKLKDSVNEVRLDIAVIKEKQLKHYDLNEIEHQNMMSLVSETKTEIDDILVQIEGLKDKDESHDKMLYVRKGVHKVVWYIIGGIGAFICGGAGWFLSKLGG